MADFLTKLALVGAAVSFAAWLALVNRRRIARIPEFISRIPRSSLSVFLAFAIIATGVAQKQGRTNAPPDSASSPQGVSAEAKVEDRESPTLRDSGVTNLCFTAISTTSNSVVLSVAWPTNFIPDGARLDFFAKSDSLTNNWVWIGCHTVIASDTNLVVEVFFQQIDPYATNMLAAGFFLVTVRETSATTMNDTDGDGVPDVYELHNGTNPYVPDGEYVPKLTVGDGGNYPSVSAALAASTNYSVVAVSAGEYVLSDSLVMPDHPVMLTGPDDGYAVLRSTASIGAVMLEDGQDSETLFRNLYVVLEARRNFQAGFWIGGNLPWSGIGASPTFENVHVRAPCPDTLYYGWHYYRDDGGRSLVSNCVMNAAGAANAIGVYSKDGPCVSVVDCRFVNFAQTNSNFATHFDEGVFVETNVVSEWASQEPGLSWSGYPTNGCYSVTADSDGDGISDYDEIFTFDTDPWLSDSDGDGVSDSQEIADETDPHLFGSFLRHAAVVVSTYDPLANTTNYVAWGAEAEGWVTNDMAALVGNHETNAFVFAPSLETVYVKAYRDLNRNGVYDSDLEELQSVLVNGNSATIDFRVSLSDRDQDGIMDWWEALHAGAGLSLTNSADALLDPDSDGLINLHEYWTGCNPQVPDGSNTLLSACARAIDDRIYGVDPSNAVFRFVNYLPNGSNGVFVANSNFWARNLDLSCVSVWNSSNDPDGRTATAITRRHVVMANHWRVNNGGTYTFCDTNGVVCTRTAVASWRIADDLCLGRLNEPLPESIKLPKILPTEHANYLGNGKYLPTLCVNQEKAATVLEIADLDCEATEIGGFQYSEYGSTLSDNFVSTERHNIRAATFGGNSGSPVFFVAGDELIFLFSKHLGSRDEPTWCYFYGPMITPRIAAVQERINAWEGDDAHLYQLQVLNISTFDELVNR